MKGYYDYELNAVNISWYFQQEYSILRVKYVQVLLEVYKQRQLHDIEYCISNLRLQSSDSEENCGSLTSLCRVIGNLC